MANKMPRSVGMRVLRQVGGLTRQQRYYRNGGREKRAAWRAQPKVARRRAQATAQWRKLNPEKHQAYLDRTRDQRRLKATQANWRRKGITHITRPRPAFCERPGCKHHALHLDHNHKTGRFRGWLCTRCNVGIGMLGDNIIGLRRAIRYLTAASIGRYTPRT